MSGEKTSEVQAESITVVIAAPLGTNEEIEKSQETSNTETPEVGISSQNGDESTTYPDGFQFGVISMSLCLCVFLVGLDATILTTAIPRITDEFGSVNDVGWYAAAFRLTSCISQLSQGKLFNNYPVKGVFLVNMAIFEIGISISGLAPTSPIFIFGRAMTGLGYSGINQGCLVIIAMSRPLPQRPIYIGVINASEFFASAVAPLIGGALTSALSWRWCFYINIPTAAVPAAIILLFLRLPIRGTENHKSQRQKLCELDLLGFTLFAPAVFCLLLALQWGGSTYSWSNGRIIALLILSPILLGIFCFVQIQKQDEGMLPPRMVKIGTVVIASVYSLSLSASRAIAQYYLPIWFQTVQNVSPLQSGINTLPLVVAVLTSAILAGWIISYSGSYALVMVPASLCVVIGVALMTTFTTASPKGLWIPSLILLGIGTGSGISSPSIAAQTVLNVNDTSIGMAIITFSEDIGEAVFISIAQSIFLNRLLSSLGTNVPRLDPSIIVKLGATNLHAMIPSQDLLGVEESYNQAVKSAFNLAVSLAACMVAAGYVVMMKQSIRLR